MKEEKDIKIEKMVLNIEGEKVSLSMDQAKKLKKILDELFGKEIIKEVEKHHYHDYWYRPYIQPYWYSTSAQAQTGNLATVYCGNNTLEISV